jgi:hypothetical protein
MRQKLKSTKKRQNRNHIPEVAEDEDDATSAKLDPQSSQQQAFTIALSNNISPEPSTPESTPTKNLSVCL